MASGDLVSLANVKSWLAITATTDDTLLTRLVTAVSQFIQTWINRDLASQAYSEIRNGHGGTVMSFRDFPVTAVSSVVIDGNSIPLAPDTVSLGYRFTETSLILQGYVFTRGAANVQISYTAGYASIPTEIEQACIELVSLRYRERDRIGHASKSLAGETVQFIVKDMPDSVRTILQNYKKVISL
jgi:uncharacterized phiE125 gp8 family phage protein